MLKKYQILFLNLQKITDSFVILFSWILAYYLRFHFISKGQSGLEILFVKLALVNNIISFYFLNKEGLYKSQRFNSKLNEILSAFKANFISFLSLVVILYFVAPERVSRLHLIIYFSISSLFLIISRIVIRNILRSIRKKGINLRHIILIGNSIQLKNYINAIYKYKDCGIKIIGWKDSDGEAKRLKISSLDSIKNLSPDTIVVGFKASDSNKLEDFLKNNYNSIIPIKIIPDLTYSYLGYTIEDFAGIPLIDVNRPNLSIFGLILKRSFDICFTILGLFFISPLLAIISLAVKLTSSGPIFYGQKRVGKDGLHFTMWKFRSMKMALESEDQNEWSNKENPRKTFVGDIIRKTSLDELPQLFNVLIGDMSLIGPRPERPFFVNKFRHIVPGYMLKHKMRAGITGWAQVNGWRGDTDIKKRIECDIYYIKNWTLFLDFKILFLTFWKGFINKNAY